MICPKCKHDVDGNYEICSNCGAMLHQTVQAPQQQQPTYAPQQPYSAPMPPQGQPQQSQAPAQGYIPQPVPAYPQGQGKPAAKSKKKLAIIIPVVAVAVVAIIAAIVIAVISHHSYDYTEIENDVKLYALNGHEGYMEFRGTEDGIYYVNSQFSPNALYEFNKDDQKVKGVAEFDMSGYDQSTSFMYYEGAYIHGFNESTGESASNIYRYSSGYSRSSVNSCIESGKSKIYYLDDNRTNLKCGSDLIYTISGEDDEVFLWRVYEIDEEVFMVFIDNDDHCVVKKILGNKISKVVANTTTYNIYVDYDGFYYSVNNEIYKYDVEDDESTLVTTVSGCSSVDHIYFVYGDRAYYLNMPNENTADIYYSELKDGKAQSVISGVR